MFSQSKEKAIFLGKNKLMVSLTTLGNLGRKMQ